MRCEDYPCCGHTDGLGCNWTAESVYNDPHLYCDHNTGWCDVEDDGEPHELSNNVFDDDDIPWCYGCDDWATYCPEN